jgi:alpha-tubulin suppressor-like RCC1 family protein
VQLTITSVNAIAPGSAHSFGLKSDGTVWGWGCNYYGQLGNGYHGTPLLDLSLGI